MAGGEILECERVDLSDMLNSLDDDTNNGLFLDTDDGDKEEQQGYSREIKVIVRSKKPPPDAKPLTFEIHAENEQEYEAIQRGITHVVYYRPDRKYAKRGPVKKPQAKKRKLAQVDEVLNQYNEEKNDKQFRIKILREKLNKEIHGMERIEKLSTSDDKSLLKLDFLRRSGILTKENLDLCKEHPEESEQMASKISLEVKESFLNMEEVFLRTQKITKPPEPPEIYECKYKLSKTHLYFTGIKDFLEDNHFILNKEKLKYTTAKFCDKTKYDSDPLLFIIDNYEGYEVFTKLEEEVREQQRNK